MFSFVANKKKLNRILTRFEVKYTFLLKKPKQKPEKEKLFFPSYLYFVISDTYFYNSLTAFYSIEELESKNFREFRINFKNRELQDFPVSSFSFYRKEKMKEFFDLLHNHYSSDIWLEKHQNKKKMTKVRQQKTR